MYIYLNQSSSATDFLVNFVELFIISFVVQSETACALPTYYVSKLLGNHSDDVTGRKKSISVCTHNVTRNGFVRRLGNEANFYHFLIGTWTQNWNALFNKEWNNERIIYTKII